MKHSRTFGPVHCVAFLGLLLTTGCEYFEDVIVPAVDNEAPNVYAAVWYQDVYEAVSANNSPGLHYTVSDPDELYVALGAGIDEGGIASLTISGESLCNCLQGNVGQIKYGLQAPLVKTQTGGVGSTVSNGLWDGPVIKLSDFDSCAPGWTTTSLGYTWTVTTEDFHGNVSNHGWATMSWP